MGDRVKPQVEVERDGPGRKPRRLSDPTPASEAAPAALPILSAPGGRLDVDGAPGPVAHQTLLSLQRTVGNAAVARRLRGERAVAAGPAAVLVDRDAMAGRTIQRDGPPTADPSATAEPKQAKPEDAAKDLLKHYAKQYLGPLGDEAKRRLARAWQESPGGVIAAGAVVGAAGVTYLVGTKSALPGLPAIPLDFIGGPFQGATIELQLDGPVTSPEAFRFKITFKEQGGTRRQPRAADAAPTIDSYANPEAIAKQVDGPEFETEIPDQGPDTNLSGANLANVVRITGNGILAGARNKETRPYVDLGELPPTPPGFAEGLKRIVDALIAAAPSTLGKIEQVNFRVYRGGQLRFIPVRPSPPQTESAEGAAP